MKIFNHKRAEALTIILVIITIVVVFFLGLFIDISPKECRTNSDCSNDFYCGSDFACHQIPVIEKTTVQNNLIVPSVIIGIAIVIAAVILKSGKMPFKKSTRQEINQEKTREETYNNPLKTP